ncbi:MAG: isopeptide-forming domain-containing fimbrial protein [Clostridia bacterium]|nr:isopeptide-forming domain-containing fimbrial protein [Clostridia bacterium]
MKMKTTRKITSLVLAVVMLLAMSVTVFAEETSTLSADNYTITIAGTEASPTEGHTYTVYQIFTGTLAEEDGKKILSDVTYGQNYTPDDTTTSTLVPKEVLDAITDANAFADQLVKNSLLEGHYAILDSSNGWKVENVPAGYYLIVDTTETLPENHTRSAYIVQVVDDVTMAPKSSTTIIKKNVKDTNDSTGQTSDWQDSADYDIGDTIPFQVSTVFSNVSAYDSYGKIEIMDTMSKGLTYNSDAKVTIRYSYYDAEGARQEITKDATESFTISSAACEDTEGKYVGGTVLTLTCDDLKTLANEGHEIIGATVTVDYTCQLNDNAVIGDAGNPNKVKLIYYREPDVKYETPDDINIVFTFKAEINKVDEEQKPLTGAEFKLEKFIADEEGTETYKDVKGNWETLQLIKNDEGTVFSFNGIDDGEYRITETQAPAGYNKIPAFSFTVTAEHEIISADPKLTDLKADGGEIVAFTVTKEDGKISNTVVNKSGAILPETGGIGTTIFYIVGAILVIAAVVVLVTRKRMSANNEE